jgi:shikimate dehydrogenase
MHNAALRELGIHWTYQLLPLPPQLFGETVRALAGLDFAGINVTVPHKEAALALADSASARAREIGAANTLTFKDGAIHAENTDAPGILEALGEPVDGLSALVLGAGGSARAAVWALREAGADVALWNRTASRADALSREFGVRRLELPTSAEVLVNCTSVGLDDRVEQTSSGDAELSKLHITDEMIARCTHVIDLVYRDPPTALAAAARRLGVHTTDGIDVLACQGALSLRSWTGREPPLELMREAARNAR